MDKYILNINLSLLLPAVSVFILLALHCYLYRGVRLTLAFFGCILLSSLGRQIAFYSIEKSSGSLPYLVLGVPFQIFRLPLIVYMGWAITFYLSWYLAERILKRIGCLSDRIFPTIVWATLIAGAISYCVEATALKAGWWMWSFPDSRLKDFLVVPFSALQGWSGFASSFLLIFFLSECSRYRKQWWRVFLYFAAFGLIITVIIFYISSSPTNIGIFTRIFDSIRLLLPVILMPFWPVCFKYGRLGIQDPKRGLFLYNIIPLLATLFILSVCIGIDIVILNEPVLLFSALPLVFLLMFSARRAPLFLIFISVAILLIIGNRLTYIVFVPTAVFFAFLALKALRGRYNLNLFFGDTP